MSDKVSNLTELSVPALADLLYAVDDPSGTPLSRKLTISRVTGLLNHVCSGRLTLESGVAVSTSDQTAKTSIYFTPYNGNLIALYDGTRWQLYFFAELTLALGTLTSDKNYDVFAYDSGGSVTLKLGPAWSSDTSRGTGAGTTEIELLAGVWVNKVSITSGPGAQAGRYLGTIRTTSTTTTEDSGGGTTTQVGGKRFVWNACNRVRRHLAVNDQTGAGWTYATATWRAANATSGNRVEFVQGLPGDSVRASTIVGVTSEPGEAYQTGIGYDSSSANSAITHTESGATSNMGTVASALSISPAIGYHYLQWIEYARAGTSTVYGDTAISVGGLSAEVSA